MCARQMAERCPGATAAGTATLSGYRFIINQRGVATLRAEESAEVYGVLWELEDRHEAALDRYEGWSKGIYDKCYREVQREEGSKAMVLVYIDHRNQRLGAPREGYLERIISGAEIHTLPNLHIAMLRAWPREREFQTFHKIAHELAGGGGRFGVPDYGVEVAQWVRENRDQLMLKALEEAADEAVSFEEALLDAILVHTEPLAEQEETARAAAEAESDARRATFLAYLESLRQREAYLEGPVAEPGVCEVTGVGIIITNDPSRGHHPDDRFIVTPHAPALAAMMDRIVNGPQCFNGHATALLPAIADTVERLHDCTDEQEVLREAFEAFYKVATRG
jgi:hypothetical protein